MAAVVYVLIFDGYADWEPALAMCEVKKSGRFEVRTVGFGPEVVTSMGGLRVTPDLTLAEVTADGAALLILPGGDMWEQGLPGPELTKVVQAFDAARVPVAAICAATVAVGQMGLMKGRQHTSNSKAYLSALVPEYQDGEPVPRRMGGSGRPPHHGERYRECRVRTGDHPAARHLLGS